MKYRVGIDVGTSSLGLVAYELATNTQGELVYEKEEILKQKRNCQNPKENLNFAKDLHIIEDKINALKNKIAKKKENITKERDKKMQELEAFLSQTYKSKKLFTIKWEII